MNKQIEGFLLVHKPAGTTSFSCIFHLRRYLGKKYRVGHTGTLDAFASGLLIIAVGRPATRHIQAIMRLDKKYTARAKWGELTDTLDIFGTKLKTEASPPISRLDIERVVQSFGKEYEQTPPVFSALKCGGQRLSCLARSGILNEQELQRCAQEKKRTVSLFDVNVQSHDHEYFSLNAHVSHGTYIRVLMHDIAQRLGTHATTHELVRTAIGPWSLEQAHKLAAFDSVASIQSRLIPIEDMLSVL